MKASSPQGKPEGKGKITFADGGTYEGDWVDGEMTGQGTARYANGAVYTGSFKDAVHDGQGPDGKPRRLSLRRRLGRRRQGRQGQDHLSRWRGL